MTELDVTKGLRLSDLANYTDEQLTEMGINPDGLPVVRAEVLKGRTDLECMQNITILLAGMHQNMERIAAAVEAIAEAQVEIAFEPEEPGESEEPEEEVAAVDKNKESK
jgi:hypothetical protein